jgi:hypothetical protein
MTKPLYKGADLLQSPNINTTSLDLILGISNGIGEASIGVLVLA